MDTLGTMYNCHRISQYCMDFAAADSSCCPCKCIPPASMMAWSYLAYLLEHSVSHTTGIITLPHDLYKFSSALMLVLDNMFNVATESLQYLSITNKMQRYTMVFITINTLHVSGGSSAHHQELKTVYTA